MSKEYDWLDEILNHFDLARGFDEPPEVRFDLAKAAILFHITTHYVPKGEVEKAKQEGYDYAFEGGYAGYGGLERIMMSDGPDGVIEHINREMDRIRKAKYGDRYKSSYDDNGQRAALPTKEED